MTENNGDEKVAKRWGWLSLLLFTKAQFPTDGMGDDESSFQTEASFFKIK